MAIRSPCTISWSDLSALRAQLSSKGGETVFENLSPGTYSITVQLREATEWNWEQDVVIEESPDDPSVVVTFELPTMEFGSVKAMVLQPDGRTPVPHGQASINSSESYDNVAFVNGKVEFQDVPVGRVCVSSKLKGTKRQSVSGHVEPNQMTDLGAIVLQRLEDVTGWVEGRVLYDDGTPALGTRLGSSGFGYNSVGAEGDFRFRLPEGENVVAFTLSHAVRWPATAVLEEQHEKGDRRPWGGSDRPPYDAIAVPVEVKVDETVTRDAILRREPLRTVTVHWAGDPEEELYLAVLVDMGDHHLIRRYSHRQAKGPTIKIRHLGTGPILVSAGIQDSPYEQREIGSFYGCHEVDAGTEDVEVTFDPDRFGTIEVATVLADGTPAPGVGAVARPVAFRPIRGLNPHQYTFKPGRGVYEPRQADGVEPKAVVRGKFQPGRYRLATARNREEAKVVEVKPGQTTRVTLVTEGQ